MTSSPQLTDTVVMVSPDQFGYNPETAETNVFQNQPQQDAAALRDAALAEFHGMVAALRARGVKVLVLPSRTDVVTPDAVFPNNWFSLHADGTLALYPMLTPNRRAERQAQALSTLLADAGIWPNETVDFSAQEATGEILEGTGSLVLDRANRVAFAMASPRTTRAAFDAWCQAMGYEGVFFHAYDKDSLPIYHTNVMLSIGEGFAVCCMEAVKGEAERARLESKLIAHERELIAVTLEQVYNFTANILHVKNTAGERLIVMSQRAYEAFTAQQREQLAAYGELLPVKIDLIEQIGGGSARCMLAEVFAPTLA
ncbi:MAG TPA: arginine deiminase-related protein [Anaerolineales bacterium]|nr:arginine deiminase-related protein [Anaerolineales bacterium]HRQ91292.1 arginine deiminase-related protein [Anaerolineales bacterium]